LKFKYNIKIIDHEVSVGCINEGPEVMGIMGEQCFDRKKENMC